MRCTRRGINFPVFKKIKVNGNGAHPLYKFLKYWIEGAFSDEIKWNFTVFICDKLGRPVYRHGPTKNGTKIQTEVQELLLETDDSRSFLPPIQPQSSYMTKEERMEQRNSLRSKKFSQ